MKPSANRGVPAFIMRIRDHKVFAPLHGQGLKALALKGSVWTIAGYGTSQIVRLGANLIMTRLLVPEVFGVMAIVNIILVGLHMFSDTGSGPSIIQSKRGNEPSFLNTAWTIQIMRGIALWGCVVIMAVSLWLLTATGFFPPSSVYADPLLPIVLPVSGITAIIASFNSTNIFSHTKKLSIARLTFMELASYLCTVIVMILWAWFSPTVWALVAGSIVGSFVTLIFSHTLLTGLKNRLYWDAEAARAQFHYGKWIFLSSIITFLTQNGDRLILGILLSTRELGVYTIAFFLTDALVRVISNLSHRIWFPVFSKVDSENKAELKSKFYRIRHIQDIIMLPLAGFLISAGDMLINLLYDSRYAEAGWMFQILAIRLIINPVLAIGAAVFMATGHPKINTLALFLQGLFLWVTMPVMYYSYGTAGAVWAISGSIVIPAIVIQTALKKHHLIDWSREIRYAPLLFLGVGIGYIVKFWL